MERVRTGNAFRLIMLNVTSISVLRSIADLAVIPAPEVISDLDVIPACRESFYTIRLIPDEPE